MSGYYIENFGCRAAQADGCAIERQLAMQGMQKVASAGLAEMVVLNTCTVTAAADQDARSAIRRVHREQPAAKILVTGCYAQRAPQEIAEIEGVTWVVGNSHKQKIGEIVTSSRDPHRGDFVSIRSLAAGQDVSPSLFVSDIFAHTEFVAAPVSEDQDRARPNLKIQDGCNNRCSFCVIPSVRGQSRSLPLDGVLREVEELECAGYRELVISGINLGRWGRDLITPMRFVDLLRNILERTSIQKLRLSSVEPMDWTDELIDLMASSPRIAKHAHVPLQSGSDVVLRKMHRKYRPWHYQAKIERIRALMPHAGIGADVMTGFPGESEELFEESLRFIERLPFTYLHVFTYSPRRGTPAATMPHQVPVEVARERNRILRNLAAQKNLEFRRSFLGKTLEAITLRRSHDGWTEALSDNYLKLEVAGQHEPNEWMQVRAVEITEHSLRAELLPMNRS
ncbi:MAG TPA: tRNA (N(6)-L-threonylcarbamoyladenosine(37)-C(2))-methylthiotransferase MtaB [Terriglobales bacterium]|nr:tRNA (N(6)-L-threonylcarbamoyladenosine(37)-C(2))-methylthiotransferase MtaB [Terriglobales bacterium]